MITKVSIPLSAYTSSNEFVVVGQSLVYRYEGEKVTDVADAVKIELFDPSILDRFVVKIPGSTLPFKEDAVESQSVRVSLINPTISPYVNKMNRIEYSVKADGVKEMKKA